MAEPTEDKNSPSILGLSMDGVADLKMEEFNNNPTAIKMLIHYYKQLLDENKSLTNERNTLRTYQFAYGVKKSNAATGALLLALSNLPMGFGINQLASENSAPGWVLLLLSVILIGFGLYFSFRKDNA